MVGARRAENADTRHRYSWIGEEFCERLRYAFHAIRKIAVGNRNGFLRKRYSLGHGSRPFQYLARKVEPLFNHPNPVGLS